ncbi:MAG: hypothetical protein B7C55_02395 [Actinomycetales bacterium mxb001]|nr:MAG: hypothetical protein B7C55_02395 [Actinomycetales bacterium mxb001]
MDYVRSHLDDLVIKSVHGHSDFSPIFGQDLDATDRTALLSQIESSPDRFVAQEWVRLSQAPVLNRRPGSIQLESRSVGLRAFAVAGVQGYEVMPGGLTRVESHRDARVVSMQRGGASKDTWVLQPGNNEELSFEPKADTPYPAIHTGIPSRLAENLFWMGRYTERAEGMTRLLRQTLSERLHHARRHNITALHELTWRYGLIALPEGETRVTRVPVEQLIQCATHPHYRQGLAETLGQLGRVAFSLRDRLSHDHWRALNRLVNDQALAENMTLGPTLVWLDRAVSSLATLSGFALDAMNRDAGWRFLSLGRRMERLVLLTSALEVTVTQLQSVSTAGETQQPLEWLLDLTDSSGSFRSQTTGIASWPAVRDIVLLDSTSPRSLRFQIDGVRQALERLAQETGVTLIGLEKTSDRLNTWEAEGLPETPELQLALADQRLEIIALSDLLATRYFSVSEHAMTV